MKTTKPTPKA